MAGSSSSFCYALYALAERPRKRAASRLKPMVEKQSLTKAETSEVADALWASGYVPSDGLPTTTALYDWAFLVLPEPEPRLADRRFRRKWLTWQ